MRQASMQAEIPNWGFLVSTCICKLWCQPVSPNEEEAHCSGERRPTVVEWKNRADRCRCNSRTDSPRNGLSLNRFTDQDSYPFQL